MIGSREACCRWGLELLAWGRGGGVEVKVEECRFKERLVVSLCKFSTSKLYHNEAFFHPCK